jgi:hypothetical protein
MSLKSNISGTSISDAIEHGPHYAYQKGHLEILQWLLETVSSDVHAKDRLRESCLCIHIWKLFTD